MVTNFSQDQIVDGIPGMIILSHGPLAGSLIQSVEMLYGEAENLFSFELHPGDNPEDFREAFAKAYEAMDDAVFLIDIFGGTPFNQVVLYGLQKEITLKAVTGVNLGMLLELVNLRNYDDNYFDQMEEIGKNAVIDIAKEMKRRNEESEEVGGC